MPRESSAVVVAVLVDRPKPDSDYDNGRRLRITSQIAIRAVNQPEEILIVYGWEVGREAGAEVMAEGSRGLRTCCCYSQRAVLCSRWTHSAAFDYAITPG